LSIKPCSFLLLVYIDMYVSNYARKEAAGAATRFILNNLRKKLFLTWCNGHYNPNHIFKMTKLFI